MKYIELLGLPGSGKTSLLRSFRRQGIAGQAGTTVLSEDLSMALRRFGYRDVGFSRGPRSRGFGILRADVLRNHFHDGWQMGIFAEYPELFSQVFLCLKTVRPEDRQRAILLNYWRSRTSLYFDVNCSTSPSYCLVDEGLSQSVFSTMSRMSTRLDQKLKLVESVLRCLPSERTVVMLQTPSELIELRAQSRKKSSPKDLSRRIAELDFIFQQQKKIGRDTIELDGSLSIDELCTELGAFINKAG